MLCSSECLIAHFDSEAFDIWRLSIYVAVPYSIMRLHRVIAPCDNCHVV